MSNDMLNKVKVQDDFWDRFQNLVIKEVIPYQEKILNDEIPGVEKSHAMANFRIAAGMEEGEYYGMVFQDSDVAKWLEGVAYSLLVHPDEDLERRADEVIEIIDNAQQKDGYLNTYYTIKEPGRRWTNLKDNHELYCAGHMMEAAAAYYEATGKTVLLHVMERMAKHIIARFGLEEGKEPGIPGHEEIELGFLRLYQVTGKKEYLEQAKYFVEQRGKDPDYFVKEMIRRGVEEDAAKMNREYHQCHATIYDQKDAVGHSVRAVYFYTAAAELASITKNEKLFEACNTLWKSIVQKRMYITGGIGSTVEGEAFTIDYDLPNDTIYAETCASIGLVFFAKKMLDNKLDGSYADVMERALYNGIISGMQMDGKRFFYVNPLEVEPGVSGELYGHKHVLPQRPEWYQCACCPPNLVRLVTSLGRYIWNEDENGIYSHMFIGNKADLEHATVECSSFYPWRGDVRYEVWSKTDKPFTFGIHIPSWLKPEDLYVIINGEPIDISDKIKDGYLYLHRDWSTNEHILLKFNMKVRKVFANQKVRENAGCVALMRGPFVYCFEGMDNPGLLQSLRIPKDMQCSADWQNHEVLGGNIYISLKGYKEISEEEVLYSEDKPALEEVTMNAIPYYLWGNRGENQMRVWMLKE